MVPVLLELIEIIPAANGPIASLVIQIGWFHSCLYPHGSWTIVFALCSIGELIS